MEIENRIKSANNDVNIGAIESLIISKTLNGFKSFLDTFEVKEVDLENELKEDWLFADKTEVDCLECMCLTEDAFVSLVKNTLNLDLKQ